MKELKSGSNLGSNRVSIMERPLKNKNILKLGIIKILVIVANFDDS